jgi:hypothetical protein
MATNAGNQYLTSAERAKKFSSGTHTASETGAKQEAANHAMNQMKQEIMQRSSSPVDFDRMIRRAGK